MKYSLKERLFLSSSAVLAGMMIISTMTTQATAASYVAHGTTDAKTAKLFKNLLKNSQHLQVHTQQRRASNQSSNVAINYTVTGTTDVKTARRLIQMFKNNKRMEVAVKVSKRSNTNNIARGARQNKLQQKQQAALMPLYTTNYPAVYMQNAKNSNVWYPVAMWQRVAVPAASQAKIESKLADAPFAIAKQ